MKKEMDANAIGGILVGAGCLIGLGIGMLKNQIAPGVLIGLGVGLVGMFVTVFIMKQGKAKK